MHLCSRLLLILALFAFAAGSTVQTAQATVMDIEMSMAAQDGDEPAGCDGCPSGDDSLMDCVASCTMSNLGSAVHSYNTPICLIRHDNPQAFVSNLVVGREIAPDLHPPR